MIKITKKFLGISALLFTTALTVGCTDPEATRQTLDDAGYTNITTTGYASFSCGKDDTYATGFDATNFHGKRVHGVVCCGWSKGCTIRH